MEWYHFLLLFSQGCVLSWILTRVMIAIAPRTGFVDLPGHRKVHYQPKPLLGGAAIFLSFLIMIYGNLLILRWIFHATMSMDNQLMLQLNALAYFASGAEKVMWQLNGIMLGGLLLFLVGLYDDRFGMNPLVKLIGQVIAAMILFYFEIYIAIFIDIPIIQFLLSLFWVVLISNSFNLLDNMDGLSGGVAMIALAVLGVSTYIVDDQGFISAICFALSGSIAGFLRYNINPSKIFMGDAGSITIGYFVAAFTMLGTFYQEGTQTATSWSVVMPVVILAVPLFDTLSVIFIRIKNGKPIYVGDKNHFSHRLVAIGMSHRRAVFFIHLTTLCVGCFALILPVTKSFGAYVVLFQTVIFFILITMLEVIGLKKNGANHS